MKRLLFFFLIIEGLLIACSSRVDETTTNQTGSIRLTVETVTSTLTRLSSSYDPKQLAVKIVNEQNVTVKQTDNYNEWKDKDITLPVGTYTVYASSYGFDGKESGFNIPYYTGAQTFTVGNNTSQAISLTCTLATVKVTVKFTEHFKERFPIAKVTVSSTEEGINPLEYELGSSYDDTRAGYIPVGTFTARVDVTGSKGSFTSSKEFSGVAARDHYELTYDVNGSGTAELTVKADPSGNLYTYLVDVSQMNWIISVDTKDKANNYAWSNKAYLHGVIDGLSEIDESKVFFEYKKQGDQAYQTLNSITVGADSEGRYPIEATLEGLTPGTEYSYRLGYKLTDDDVNYSREETFTTEEQTKLRNGNMDEWYAVKQSNKKDLWYACSESYFNANNTSWWDSSNKGSLTIASSNTTKNTDNIHTAGGSSAQIKSIFAGVLGIGKFAAGSLYVGQFGTVNGANGASLDWGRPFTSRPTSLHGWIWYSTGKIDYVGSGTPKEANITRNKSTDMCSAYIALMHVDNPNKNETAITVDNTNMSTFPNWKNDERVVAYAELPMEECGSTNNEWKEINLNLKYYKKDVKPTHIIIVFSSSKYGDYFTGSTNSILYVDDLELIY